MSTSLTIAIVIIAFIIGAALASGLVYVRYNHKINKVVTETQNLINRIQDSTPTLEIDQRIKCTRELLTLIDDTVTLELVNNKRYEIFLDKRGKNMDIDKDIEEISKAVFNSIKPEIFSDKNLVMTKEYLMRCITKRTFVAVLTYVDKNMMDQLTQKEQA
jgi:ribonucleotide reductase alpha subunit